MSDIGKNWNPELNGTQKGLIQTAFIVCYFASAPIFGFLGDRYSRKWLMAFGVVAWGICTVASSFMKVQFFFIIKIFKCNLNKCRLNPVTVHHSYVNRIHPSDHNKP